MSELAQIISALAGGLVLELEHDRYVGAPIFPAHWPGFVYTLHRRHEEIPGEQRTSASGTITMQEHSGTHIDALCHQAIDMEMFGGIRVDSSVQGPRGFTELGVETIPPILRRGVLLDVAAVRGVDVLAPGELVTAADLELALKATGVTTMPGDCLFVRTGNGAIYGNPEAYLAGPGVGADAARWLATQEPFLCGGDNVAFDVPTNVDAELGTLPCHTVLIVANGIYIAENVNLEPLAEAGCHEFLFVCLPMKMTGVTGSPVRPVAISFDS